MVVEPNQTLIVMMLSLSYRALALCALLFLIVGCAGIERFLKKFEPEEVFYREVGQSLSVWRSTYTLTDSLEVKYFLFCAESGKDGSKRDRVYHDFNESEVKESITNALKHLDLPTRKSDQLTRVDSNNYCELNAYPFNEYFIELLADEKHKFPSVSPQLFLAYQYGAFWDYEVEAAPPAGLVTTGRSKYRVNRQLIAAVLEHDTIAYMNYYFHRDTAYVDDGELLEYKWPQEIWDSLTVLTMQRYKDRLQ